MPKTSPFFPKFVDPAAMISKKTSMLSNLFGGLGPVDYAGQAGGGFSPFAPSFGGSGPVLYSPEVSDFSSGPQGFASVEKGKEKRGESGEANFQINPESVPKLGSKMSEFVGPFGLDGSSGFPSKYSAGFFDSAAPLRSRRSVVEPDFPEPESAGTPKQMIPGMFGPFGPFKPFAGATELPIPKSTIVPADFWLPSSIFPGPTEYTDKVSSFLQKLFDNLKLNKTASPLEGGFENALFKRSVLEADSSPEKTLAPRSIDDVKSLAAAKEIISDSIVAELAELKADLVGALNDYIVYEKTAALAAGAKKPVKPISPFAAFFAKPTVDPALPFKQRITVLSQVFDMLTDLQKNVSSAVQDAIKVSNETFDLEEPQIAQTAAPRTDFFSAANPNVSDPSKAAFTDLEKSFVSGPNPIIFPADFQAALNARILSNYLAPFYASRPDPPTAAKRNVDNDYQEISDENNRDQYKRLVHMNMHQGYQSMPPGTIESVQAGGGSVPGHQGGGIKLLVSTPSSLNCQSPKL